MVKKKPEPTTSLEDLVNEIEKVKAQIRELTNQLEDSEIDLSASVRLSAQRRELEAYVCGILYALGQREPFDSAMN